jgi:DNA (cytosine-5)-methyltransferase 1
MTLTITDLFCGAGGSSSGAEMVPGVTVRMAANHWRLAVETHSHNLPHADHDVADISQVNPRRYPRTHLLWASPECTNHSQAKGRKSAVDAQPDLFGEVLPDEAAERSRATMWDVLRFAEHHRYLGGVVENVVQVRDWVLWPSWVTGLQNLGYDYHVVYLNSMFAKAAGLPAPQSRDRLYVVFWRSDLRKPDFDRWTRPEVECGSCSTTGKAVQAWKRSDRQRGRYREQYVWRCAKCAAEVFPSVLPAASAINWAMPGQRIGDRTYPLADKTRARIEAGLRRYGRPIHLEAAGHTFERPGYFRAWPIDDPFKTMNTSATKGFACPPMLVPTGGSWNEAPALASEPFRTRTTTEAEALACPPFIVPAGSNWGSLARSVEEPFTTRTSRDVDALVQPWPTQAIVMRNNTARGDPGQMTTPVYEPIRTITTTGHQSLIRWDHMVYDYNARETSCLQPVATPLPTQTTIEGDALLGPEINVEDCTFRMLEPDEIQSAMAFGREYDVLGKRREKIRQLGNAVTPPAARDLIAALSEAITGEVIA